MFVSPLSSRPARWAAGALCAKSSGHFLSYFLWHSCSQSITCSQQDAPVTLFWFNGPSCPDRSFSHEGRACPFGIVLTCEGREYLERIVEPATSSGRDRDIDLDRSREAAARRHNVRQSVHVGGRNALAHLPDHGHRGIGRVGFAVTPPWQKFPRAAVLWFERPHRQRSPGSVATKNP